MPGPLQEQSRVFSFAPRRRVSDCAESRSREVRTLRDARDVDLAGVVDAVPKHRDPFEPVADTDGDMSFGISAQMPEDAVAVDAPREHFRPAAVVIHFEFPGLAAHRVLSRHNLYRPPAQGPIDRPQHT